LLRLITLNGQTITQSLYQTDPVYPCLSKYINYLKDSLNLSASLAKLDTQGSRFQLLKLLSKNKKYVDFEGAFFIPLYSESDIWGYIKIQNSSSESVSSTSIKKALQALNSMVPESLLTEPSDQQNFNCFTALVLNTQGKNTYRLVIDHFYKDKFVSFINLSEWLNLKQPFSLKYLREFKNSLFYVHELMDLSRSQRTTLALYSMLPKTMKKSSLVLASAKSVEEIKSELIQEKGFLKEFLEKQIDIADKNSINLN